MKRCGTCKSDLPKSMFGNNRRNPDGLHCSCKKCKSDQDKAYQRKHKEKIASKKHVYYLENKDETIARVCLYAKENRVKHNAWGAKSKNKLKSDVFSHYSSGTIKCKNCVETSLEVLSIDHIDGNGAAHRRELFGNNRQCGYNFYRWLKKNNYPDGFQVLCFNCQFRKRLVEIRPDNPTHLQQVRAKYARSIKLECLDNYGGRVCACGEDDPDVLTLDHVNDDGADHRRDTGTRGQNFYHMLRKNCFLNEPPLQVMCLNCQIKKRQRKYDEGKNRSTVDSDGPAIIV